MLILQIISRQTMALAKISSLLLIGSGPSIPELATLCSPSLGLEVSPRATDRSPHSIYEKLTKISAKIISQ